MRILGGVVVDVMLVHRRYWELGLTGRFLLDKKKVQTRRAQTACLDGAYLGHVIHNRY